MYPGIAQCNVPAGQNQSPASPSSLLPAVSAFPLLNNSPSLHPSIISSFRSTASFLFPSLAHSLPPFFSLSHCPYVLLYFLLFLLVVTLIFPILFFLFDRPAVLSSSLSFFPLPSPCRHNLSITLLNLTLLRRSVWTKSLCRG